MPVGNDNRSPLVALERFALELMLTLVDRGVLSQADARELLSRAVADFNRVAVATKDDAGLREAITKALDDVARRLEDRS